MTKDELIDKYRHYNVDGGYNWWESVHEDLKNDLKGIGFKLDQMHFSGFWSQGDGACFTGYMSDWSKFCEGVPEFVRDFPNLSVYLKDEGGTYSISHRGNYCHEMCTSHEYSDDVDYWLETNTICEDALDPEDQPLDLVMRIAIYSKAEQDGDVETWLTEHFRGLMCQLYEDLEAVYDYLTSDECVWEMIQINELDNELEDDDDMERDTEQATQA